MKPYLKDWRIWPLLGAFIALYAPNFLFSDSIGATSSKPYIGRINRPLIHLTKAQVIEISDQLMQEEIAEVDINWEELEERQGKISEKKKTDDEIEFQ